MKINPMDYRETLKHLVTGQSIKVAHLNCSDSKAMSVTMDVEGYLFHCFKCQGSAFLAHEQSTFRDRKKREAEKAAYQRERQRAGFNLPADFGQNIDSAGLAWLGTGGWTSDLIVKHGVGWSSFLSRVVFKVEPLGYVARAVHSDQVPKYLSKTPKLSWWASEPLIDRVCLTEDILSAGRVGQVYPAMAMLGTDQINLGIITKAKQVLIWTDNDKAGEKARRNIHAILDWIPDVQCLDIHSTRDPKRYTTEEIIDRLQKGGAYF